jgi:hypothetical protein
MILALMTTMMPTVLASGMSTIMSISLFSMILHRHVHQPLVHASHPHIQPLVHI